MGKSKYTEAEWHVIGARYRDDVETPGRELARTLGLHYVTLTSACNRLGYFRTVQTGLPPDFGVGVSEADADADASEGEGEGAIVSRWSRSMRFDYDRAAPEATVASLCRQMSRAADEGRPRHFRQLMLCLKQVLLDRGTGHSAPPPEIALRASTNAEPLDLRPAQTPPDDPWSTWLFLGGRGAGKTLAGSAWLAAQADRVGPGGRLALVGATLHDVREVMIGGPSGLMSLPRWFAKGPGGGWSGPAYEPSRRRLRFPNGAEAFVFSAEDPDSLRGPQFEAAWADEFCAWARPDETLAMLRLGLRLGDDPRLMVTTTPRPMRALKGLRAEAACVVTHAPTRDNLEHLAPGFLDGLTALYGGTRREAQELDGLVVEMEGGLFRTEDLARARTGERPDRFDRIVVAVDPTTTQAGDACGIVAVGRVGEVAHVLADRSMRGLTPDAWARRAIALMDEVGAREIVAEVNQGGEMVVQTLKTARPDVTVRQVRATQGKRLRAEPVAALYEQGRVKHTGAFKDLEEELMALGGADEGRMSLDRADALVWAVTELMLNGRGEGPRVTWL